MARIERQAEPELKGVKIVRGPDDIDPRRHAAISAIVLQVVVRSAITVTALRGVDHSHGLRVVARAQAASARSISFSIRAYTDWLTCPIARSFVMMAR